MLLENMHDTQCIMHNTQCTIHNAQCSMHNEQCTMHNKQCTSAVKTVVAWRQCREESYQKVRKVIENVCFSPMYFLTFYNFPQQFPHFFLLLPPFFLCRQSCSNIFPHSFPHFSSQSSLFFLTFVLIFSHNFTNLFA